MMDLIQPEIGLILWTGLVISGYVFLAWIVFRFYKAYASKR